MLITTERLRREQGASLVLALALMLVLGVVLSAVIAYANTNYRAANTYRRQRVSRYAGDGALEAAVNYVRGQAKMGRDPNYASSDPPCVYNVPTDAGTVTVTCSADPGSNSGVPTDTGLVPNQAILALGQRHNEVGPLNQTQCNTIFGIGKDAIPEQSIYFAPGEVRGYFEEGSLIPCNDRNRSFGNFTVRGKIVAAGKVAGSGQLTLQPTLVDGVSVPASLKALYGCAIAVSPGGCGVPTSGEYADPGNNGTDTAWQHVPINWNNVRTTGYHWDGTQLVAATSCGARDTIIMLPGVYRDANVINKYTANSGCKESTIWFAPEAGDDGVLLTDDDKTGAYYFGFTNGNTDWSCSDMSANPHRLCIGGGSADSSPRVVVGTPDGWNPLGVPGSVTPRTVTMTTAQTVDDDLSQSWQNGGNASVIDGSVASYVPTFCLFGICISSDRGIRLRNMAPQVAQGPDASANKITIEIAHRETGSMDTPRINIRTVSPESGTRTCPNNYTVPTNSTGSIRVDKLQLGGSTDAAAAAIAQCLDSADRINGVEIYLRWTGNPFNSGSPRVYLDGARLSFQSTPGASFPISGGSGSAAIIDCDKTKAGGQLIFGGDSFGYVPDGSLEICAGPYPSSPGDHQQIAVWGVPAVAPIRPTSVSASSATFIGNPSGSNAYRIAEPGGRQDLNIRYSTGSTCGFCTINFEGRAVMNMGTYSAPSGLQVSRIDARVTYNSNNLCILGWCPFGTASQLRVGGCNLDAPATADIRHWEVNLYGGGNNCLSPSTLASGAQVTWAARAKRICAFWICGSGSYTDQLDGVELLVSDSQTNGSTTPVPQSGCIVDYPNYWEGVGRDDCAILKADSLRPNNIFTNEADWVGRLSIQGTVYAPSAALEIDDIDSAYSLASRGLVVRHLRVKGFKPRAGYTTPVIDTQLDTTPQSKEDTFVACFRGPGRASVTTKCDKTQGDRILTRARVQFEYNSATPTKWTPHVEWWVTTLGIPTGGNTR
ncbi:MAG: hypothetical protein U0P45_04910 [Acidimicrobiales bacterium]